MGRIENTQLDILKPIPVAQILVHNFEDSKAKENGRGKRPVMIKTARYAWRIGEVLKLYFADI